MVSMEEVYAIAKRGGKDQNVTFPNTTVNLQTALGMENALKEFVNVLLDGKELCVTKVTNNAIGSHVVRA